MNRQTPNAAPPGRVDSYFEITARGSRVSQEVLAGLSTFLSLAYIFVVNPSILSAAGMDVSAVFFATVVASGVSTIFMGMYARLPFALAPGLEMNGFVAFVVCGVLGLTWQQALGAVFWSGVLCWALSVLPVRRAIVDSIPDGLKANLSVSVGVFVMVIGLFLAKIISFDARGLLEAPHLWVLGEPPTIALLIGLALSIIFNLNIKRPQENSPRPLLAGGFLVAIIVAAIYGRSQGMTQEAPAEFGTEMFSAVGALDLWAFFTRLDLLPVFLVLFLIDFYGSIGKFIGLTASTPELSDSATGELRGMKQAMVVDGLGTIGGAWIGTSSIITYVESAVGIKAGGRTGLAAVVCGILMLLCLFLTSLVGLVPVVATSGILIYVGYLLLPRYQFKQGTYGRFDAVVGIGMGVISFATFSLDKAMVFGFGCYAIDQFRRGKKNWLLLIGFLLILASVLIQFTIR